IKKSRTSQTTIPDHRTQRRRAIGWRTGVVSERKVSTVMSCVPDGPATTTEVAVAGPRGFESVDDVVREPSVDLVLQGSPHVGVDGVGVRDTKRRQVLLRVHTLDH